MADVDVLIPTCDRPAALAVTLSGLLGQRFDSFRVVVSDQSEDAPGAESSEVATMVRLLELRGVTVQIARHLPRRGMAEQRQFLLDSATADRVLFVDDDVWMEPTLLGRMATALDEEGCGFVGSAVVGLSYLDDVRPHEQAIEFWDEPVQPERLSWRGPSWERHAAHNAANLHHIAERLGVRGENQRKYRVAWCGGCVMYDRAKLIDAGGFEFWRELPPVHCGEDVLAQFRVMAHFGGFGLLPSGAYHLELQTTLPDRRVNAPEVLPTFVPLKSESGLRVAASAPLSEANPRP